MKKKNSRSKWIKLAIVATVFIIYFFSTYMIVPGCVDNMDDIYDVTTKAIRTGRTKIRFTTSDDPDYLDYEEILMAAMEKDMYSAGEFYEYAYYYTENSDGDYRVKLKLNKPSLFRRYFAKKRVKQIAKKYGMLGSDYEKVKAVHDYIVLYNEYRYVSGGAYKAICKGTSACNGYGLAFYEIMTELGIPCTIELGDNHMWNSVKIDGEWYNIDCTWDDPGDGTVHYDYFLKSDQDFPGHDYGSATAKKSMEITGKSAEEYYRMIPNHKITRIIYLLVVIAIGFGIIYVLAVVLPKRKAREKLRQQELLEKTMRQNRELLMLDNQMESGIDKN